MKTISLTQNKKAIVNDIDFEKINKFKWYAHKDGNTFYAIRHAPTINGKRPLIRMHHEVAGKPPKGFVSDHKNGNGLDNRRENLRFVTIRQNGQNQKNRKSTSKYPGVYWDSEHEKWRAGIRINGKTKSLGRFKDEEKAFNAYMEANNNIREEVLGYE